MRNLICMIQQIAYFSILGFPVIMYFGIFTLLGFFVTALIGYINVHGNHAIPYKWHPRLAYISVGIAIIHALMGLSGFLNF